MDGTLLLSASYDGLIRLWDSMSGQCLKTIIGDDIKNPPVSFACFTPNCLYVLVGTLDDTSRLWNYETGKVVKVYRGHSNRKHPCIAKFSADGLWVGSEDGWLYCYDVQSGAVVAKVEGSPVFDIEGNLVARGQGENFIMEPLSTS